MNPNTYASAGRSATNNVVVTPGCSVALAKWNQNKYSEKCGSVGGSAHRPPPYRARMYSQTAPLSPSVIPAAVSSMNGDVPDALPGRFFRAAGAPSGSRSYVTSLYSSPSSSSSQTTDMRKEMISIACRHPA